MDFELRFVKSDNEVWGFRLTGGAEYDVPFTVVNVSENSVAENSGLKCRDVIVSVNGVVIEGLIHHEAHNMLLAAGNNLILGIKRDLTDVISPVTNEEEVNQEVTNIMQPYLDEEDNQFELKREVEFEIINPLENQEQAEHALEAHPQSIAVQLESKEREWSTFLQKPKNPKPVVKKEVIQGEPYRVIIKKQIKKTDEEECPPCQQDLSLEESNTEEPKTEEFIEMVEEVPTEQIETQQEEPTIEEQTTDNEEETAEINTEETIPTIRNDVLEKILEEKLAEVQKQLEALSKLPSTIQSTIEAVTQQIASIVTTTAMHMEEEKEETVEIENEFAEELIREECEEDVEHPDQTGEDTVQSEISEEELKNIVESEDETIEEEVDAVIEKRELTEQEIEALKMAEELAIKQQKEQDLIEEFKQRRLKQKPTLPLKPIERPIILPGGRRWSQPDDACPVVRDKKMSDEKIANTIETYSEVILGKTKGLTIGTRYGLGLTKKRLFAGIVSESDVLYDLTFPMFMNLATISNKK